MHASAHSPDVQRALLSAAVPRVTNRGYGLGARVCELLASGAPPAGDSAAATAAPPPAERAPEPPEAVAEAVVGMGSKRARCLHMGSADPHGLELNDDRVVRSRRAPTFALAAHRAASREELLGRPVAALNVPESCLLYTSDAADE